MNRTTMLKTRAVTALLALVLLTACSGDEPPVELPFQENETDVQTDDAASPDPSVPETEPGTTTTVPEEEPVAIVDVWESADIDPDLADCYSTVFADAGIDEVDDLRDFAERTAEFTASEQQALDACVSSEAN